ncbi:MAG: hypothetical protein E7222_10010 [Clostridiales bacterium]|nr:hypothetical protein [Clostridiales bacterium]
MAVSDLEKNVCAPVEMPKAYKIYLDGVVENAGKSLNDFITDAIGEKIDKTDNEEIPAGLIQRIMEWLKDHGHSDKEILDCILYMCKDESDE